MQLLDIVLNTYLASSTVIEGGNVQRRKVGAEPVTDADRAILLGLPELLQQMIAGSGRSSSEYQVYGSVGQINYWLANIPWVSALHKGVTRSTQRGYYIVLLFREDMEGCVLSLNQGFTQYKKAFGTDRFAAGKVRETAQLAQSYVAAPPGFIRGPIDLGATRGLGIGYEQGAILSKEYRAGDEVDVEQFSKDFGVLLEGYDVLRARFGNSLIEAAPLAAEDEFQEAAAELSNKESKSPYVPPPPGPVPRPPKGEVKHGGTYRRNPAVAGAAMVQAGYLCELEPTHVSFTSRTTKKNYVEAHHLLPMQYQEQFDASLDLLENIVVLCPTCHRKLHHGLVKEKPPMLEALFTKRSMGLTSRGLSVTLGQLTKFYKGSLEEE